MKFSTATIFSLLAASISGSYAKPFIHPRPLLRRLDLSDDEDDEPVTKRECELENDSTMEVEFKCKSKTKSELLKMEDKIKYKVKYDEKGLKVKVKYEQEIKSKAPETSSSTATTVAAGDEDRRRTKDTTKTETETEYEVVFDRLIEYAKPAGGAVAATASSQAYNFAQDAIVTAIDLTQMSAFTPVTIQPNGDITWSISTTDGVVTFFFTISPGGENAEVTANKMKIDVDIKGYQWQQSTSNVAILAKVESEVEVDVDYSDDEETLPSSVAVQFGTSTIDASMLRPFGDFTWAREAVVYSAGGSNSTTTNTTTGVTDGFTNNTTNTMVSTAQAGAGTTGNSTSTPPAALSNATNGTVAVATATIQVVATSPSDGSDTMAFSFVGSGAQMADEIFWDPEAGIGYAPASGAVGYGLAAVAGMMMAAVTGLL